MLPLTPARFDLSLFNFLSFFFSRFVLHFKVPMTQQKVAEHPRACGKVFWDVSLSKYGQELREGRSTDMSA